LVADRQDVAYDAAFEHSALQQNYSSLCQSVFMHSRARLDGLLDWDVSIAVAIMSRAVASGLRHFRSIAVSGLLHVSSKTHERYRMQAGAQMNARRV
jgi:hypothetical protein